MRVKYLLRKALRVDCRCVNFPEMSKFPSIEEFDSGQVTATKLEDLPDEDFIGSTENDLFTREQEVLGNDADFFQAGGDLASPTCAGDAAFFGGEPGNACRM
jgi:hypothetical protein